MACATSPKRSPAIETSTAAAGRYPVTWHTTPVQLTSAEQVVAYDDAGWLAIADAPVRLFFCSVQRIH
jgi:hypothetical protein